MFDNIINEEEQFEEAVIALTANKMNDWRAKQPTIEEHVERIFKDVDIKKIVGDALK